MNDRVKRKCPECGRNQLERLIGMGAGVLFKGGGFYQTDYRSESYKQGERAEKNRTDGAEPSSKPGKSEANQKTDKPKQDAAKKSSAKKANSKAKASSSQSKKKS